MQRQIPLASLSLLLTLGLACNGDDGATSDGASATEATSDSESAGTTEGSGSASASETATTTAGGGSMSDSDSGVETDSDATTTGTDSDTSTTAPVTTSETDSTTDGTTTDGTTTDGTTDGTTEGTTEPGAICGNGIVEEGEECDDGNNVNLDECDADCTLPCAPGDGGMMGDIENSFLWVANTNQGSISKVDTQAVVELARYRSGPSGGTESPSRTAVSIDGRYVVVANRGTGRVTAIAANQPDCLNNGANTSQNPNDLLPWGTEDCAVWSTVLPIQGSIGSGPRGVTWTPGEWNADPQVCGYDNPKVWVGYLPNQGQTAHMARLNGSDGSVEETVAFNNWMAQGWTHYGPYGAAIDKGANVWTSGLRGELFRINTNEDPITFDRWNPPTNLQFYGMTVDPDGEPWFGGCSGPVSTFNPETQQFTAIPGTQACYRGLAADKAGNMWVASNGPCGVAQIDHVTNTLVQFHVPPQCSTPVGVSTDIEGFVWVVDQAGWTWKIDPENPQVQNWQQLVIPGNHYTYSDMTGGQAQSVILPQ